MQESKIILPEFELIEKENVQMSKEEIKELKPIINDFWIWSWKACLARLYNLRHYDTKLIK